jgi:hypothetical protein
LQKAQQHATDAAVSMSNRQRGRPAALKESQFLTAVHGAKAPHTMATDN